MNKGKDKQPSQNTIKINVMDVDKELSCPSLSFNNINLDIHTMNLLIFGEVKCMSPPPRPSGVYLTQCLECNTKLWFEKLEEDERKKREGEWVTSHDFT